MHGVADYPPLVFLLSFMVLWGSIRLGVWLRRRKELAADIRDDFDVVQTVTLTLLALIIGFSFSMAVGRYDQRKNYEEEEANAIGTEYLRVGLLATSDAARAQALLSGYLDQRIAFYIVRDADALRAINTQTARTQAMLWATVRAPVAAQPTPVAALVVSGMNDVLNTQGYTQAAWWNRIPTAAWALMLAIAICGHLMLGYGARRLDMRNRLQLVLPMLAAMSFLLISDIDSPRGGLIRVKPLNLITLAESLPPH